MMRLKREKYRITLNYRISLKKKNGNLEVLVTKMFISGKMQWQKKREITAVSIIINIIKISIIQSFNDIIILHKM